jgi:DNA-binding transcriptional LysR family regulator
MHSYLNLTYLKFFYDAVENQSVSQAAKHNFVTQSAISQGILKLEKSLGVQLTTHQKHHFKLTPDGQLVFSQTKQIFKMLKDMQEELQQDTNIIKGSVFFICPPSIAMSLILAAMQQVKTLYPDVSVHFRVGSIELIHSCLKNGNVDFALILNTPDFISYDKQLLRQGYFQAYTKTASLHDGVLVDRKEGLYVKTLRDMYQKQYKKELVIKQELDSWEVVARFVEGGMSCGFFPDYLLENNRYPTIVPCEEKLSPIPYEIMAVYPKGDKLSKGVQAFLNLLKQETLKTS